MCRVHSTVDVGPGGLARKSPTSSRPDLQTCRKALNEPLESGFERAYRPVALISGRLAAALLRSPSEGRTFGTSRGSPHAVTEAVDGEKKRPRFFRLQGSLGQKKRPRAVCDRANLYGVPNSGRPGVGHERPASQNGKTNFQILRNSFIVYIQAQVQTRTTYLRMI